MYPCPEDNPGPPANNEEFVYSKVHGSLCARDNSDGARKCLTVQAGRPTGPIPPAALAPMFVKCVDAKNPLCGPPIFFVDTATETRHPVASCNMCGVLPCVASKTISSAALTALHAGSEFDCSMLPPPVSGQPAFEAFVPFSGCRFFRVVQSKNEW